MTTTRDWVFPAKKAAIVEGSDNGQPIWKTMYDDTIIAEPQYKRRCSFNELCEEEKQFILNDYFILVSQMDKIYRVLSSGNVK